jgi:hypothetical protein
VVPLQPSTLEVLDAFYVEHSLCGELDGAVNEYYVWLACLTCGTPMVRLAR